MVLESSLQSLISWKPPFIGAYKWHISIPPLTFDFNGDFGLKLEFNEFSEAFTTWGHRTEARAGTAMFRPCTPNGYRDVSPITEERKHWDLIANIAFMTAVVVVFTGQKNNYQANRDPLVPDQVRKLPRLSYEAHRLIMDSKVINTPAWEAESQEDLFGAQVPVNGLGLTGYQMLL